MTSVTLQRDLGEVLPEWLAGDPATWLPRPVRRSGPHRWTFPVRGGPFSVVVSCRVGDVWRRGEMASRSLAWEPVGDPDAALGDERLLPRLQGELIWSLGEEGGTSVRLVARYEPPGRAVGRAIDRLALHRVAEQTLAGFLDDVCRTWPVKLRAARPASPRA
jgi:hypothetical protein